MSLCLNNDLIWVSIPRCASMSIEKSIVEHPNIEYRHISEFIPEFKNKHAHINLGNLKNHFGDLESVCVKRDWLDRWMSSLEYIWFSIKINNLTPKYNYNEIDNNFIYKTFTNDFLNKLNIIEYDFQDLFNLYCLFINETKDEIEYSNYKYDNLKYTAVRMLCSQNFWLDNEKCTYEFDINKLHEFESFISKRYSIDFNMQYVNKTNKQTNKIVIDNELRNFIWDKFEKPYIRQNKLI